MPLDFTWMDQLSGTGEDPAPQPDAVEAPQLERQAKGIQEERQRIASAYKEYQTNVKLAGQNVREVRKGITAGEDIYSLFLKAIDAIGKMTGDESFYDQTKAAIVSVYGVGLGEPQPLQMELDGIRGRLSKLEAARATADPDSQRNIDRAIMEHKRRADEIQAKINA